MPTVRKTITVTDQQDHWIKAQVTAGDFTNESEYIRDMIRREQAYQEKVAALRAAITAGEESGPAQPFDATAFKQKMRVKYCDEI